MELTREEAVRNYREHWASLAITGVDKDHKGDYLERNGYGHILHKCFLCEFTRDGYDKVCSKCPIEWPVTKNREEVPCVNSYYGDWEEASTPEERKRLAAIIRDLPEKQKEEPKPEFKIGDWVKVVDYGYSFSTYDEFFTINHLEQFAQKYARGNTKNGEKYKIVAIGKHESCGYGALYVLEKDDKVYLIHNGYPKRNKPALKLTEPPKPEPKYKKGDKVFPVSKTVPTFGCPLDKDAMWRECKEHGYFYVVNIDEVLTRQYGKVVYGCSATPNDILGNVFFESDLRPYVEPKAEKQPEPQEPRPFKVGDKVKVLPEMPHQGKIGVIAEILNDYCYLYGVESNEEIFSSKRWNNNHPEKINKGHYFDRYMLELIPSINLCPEPKTLTESKTITFEGNKTTCTIEIDGRKFTGVAKCDPNDKWDEEIGRQYAELRANRKMLDAVEKELRRG